MALSVAQWVEREQARHVAQGLPSHVTDASALGVLAALLTTAEARSGAPRMPQDARKSPGVPVEHPAA